MYNIRPVPSLKARQQTRGGRGSDSATSRTDSTHGIHEDRHEGHS